MAIQSTATVKQRVCCVQIFPACLKPEERKWKWNNWQVCVHNSLSIWEEKNRGFPHNIAIGVHKLLLVTHLPREGHGHLMSAILHLQKGQLLVHLHLTSLWHDTLVINHSLLHTVSISMTLPKLLQLPSPGMELPGTLATRTVYIVTVCNYYIITVFWVTPVPSTEWRWSKLSLRNSCRWNPTFHYTPVLCNRV